MNCEQYKNLLPLYASGDLGPKESGKVAEHLEACSTCRAKSEKLTEVIAMLTPRDSDNLTDLEKLRMENEVYSRLAKEASIDRLPKKGKLAARVVLRVAAALMFFILGYSARPFVSQPYESPHAETRVLRHSGSITQYQQALASGLRFSSQGLKAIAGSKSASSWQSD